jgi:hypothetical protein
MRQEDLEFQGSLGYIVKACLKKNPKEPHLCLGTKKPLNLTLRPPADDRFQEVPTTGCLPTHTFHPPRAGLLSLPKQAILNLEDLKELEAEWHKN